MSASRTFFAVAALQLFCGGAAICTVTDVDQLPKDLRDHQPLVIAATIAEMLIRTGVFLGLGFWARWQPLLACMVGFALYLGLLCVISLPPFLEGKSGILMIVHVLPVALIGHALAENWRAR